MISRLGGSGAMAKMQLAMCVIVTAMALASCSRSPSEAVETAAEAAGHRLMQPLLQKDASVQAGRMAGLLSDKPECEVFKKRMVDAGKHSPYEGTTQWELVHAHKDACAAGCCKQ
jgi:hypothetical protein